MSLLFLLFSLLADHGSLGILVSELEPMVAAQSAIYNLKGVVVRQVFPNSGSARAGIHENDIITSIAGETVNGLADVPQILSKHQAGEIVVVKLVRPGKRLPYPAMTVRVTLMEASDVSRGNAEAMQPGNAAPMMSPARGAPHGFRTVENSGAISMTQKQAGKCTALAPANWEIIGTREQGDAIDIVSGDRRSYAGWNIRGVNRQMQAYYGELYADPVTSSRFLVGAAGQSVGDTGPYSYVGQPKQLGGGFMAAELQSAGHSAMIVYRLYPAPMLPPGGYIISLRIAIAPRSASGAALRTATGVAVGINCTTMFVAPKGGDSPLPRPGDAFDRKRRGGETNDLEGYNVQLGTQYVHSPSTGENYLVDRTSAWNDNGPQGAGFYRKVGNSYEKLEAGMR
jgi:hypothetical protein